MSIEKDLDNYKNNIITWFESEIYKAFSDLAPAIIEGAAVVLMENNKFAGGKHIKGLQTKVKPIAKNELGFYLFSDAKSEKGFEYDKVILAGSHYTNKMPPPTALEAWIIQKQARGMFTAVKDTRSLSFAIAKTIFKRGHHATFPFDYIGFMLDREKANIIKRFQEIK